MPDLTAKRTLVKSPPELWEELSEVDGLAKHFGAFGEIKITKLEPEHTVAWEGEHASGTVSIEPSGWGTKVTLHAELPEREEEPVTEEPPEVEQVAEEPAPDDGDAADDGDRLQPVPASAEEPVAETEEPQAPRKRRGFWAWLFRPRTGEPEIQAEPVVAEPEPEPEPEPDPEPVAVAVGADAGGSPDPERARVILDEALDALGAAHHRPFSRG